MKKNNIAVILILAVSAVLFTLGVIKKVQHMRQAAAAAEKTVAVVQKGTIAVIPKGTASMWWEVVHQGAKDAAQEEGYKVFWNGPEQETDREKQRVSVEDAVTRGVDAIVLGPNDAKALAPLVEKIREKNNKPVVIMDSRLQSDKIDSFVATDNYAGGADAAKRLGKSLNGKGRVILTRFIQNSASTDEREKGFKETLAKEFPEITIVAEQYTTSTVEDARQKTEDMLTKNAPVDGVFAVNQPTSVGAYMALQNKGLAGKVKFVGYDSQKILLDGIEKGEVDALIVQDPYQIGYIGVKTAIKIIEGGEVDDYIQIPSMIVDQDNLEEQKQKNPAALGLDVKAVKQNTTTNRTIAVIPKGTASMWWEVVRKGAETAGEEEGCKIFWTGPEQETDREKQRASVEDAVTRGVNAIVLAPNDAKALAPLIEKIREKNKKPVVIIDSRLQSDKIDSFVATDNYAGGADAAKRLGKSLNGKGRVILTRFIQNSASTDERERGFRETLAKEFPEITIVADQYTTGTVEDARQKTEDMLTKNTDINGVFAVNQPTSVGAYMALQNKGLAGKVKFVGFDSQKILLDGIEKGEVEALIVQDPYQIGYTGVKTVLKILDGEEVKDYIQIPSMIVDQDNLAEQKQKNPAALGL